MKIVSTLSIFSLFALALLIGCRAIPIPGPPVTDIITHATPTEVFEEQEKVVLEWMKQNLYYLYKQSGHYLLTYRTTVLHASQVNDPEAWTKTGIKTGKNDLTLEVYHDHFVIQIKDVGEAAFTLDENDKLQPYDLTEKEK